MNKKTISLVSMSLFLLILFAGCTGPAVEDPTIKKIKDAGVLKVGTSTPFEPMEYTNESGDFIGFDIDIANEIATYFDVEVEIVDFPVFDDIFTAVKNGSIDVGIAAITINLERSLQFLFSDPYLNAGQVIMVREEEQNISSPQELANRTVGVQNGTVGEEEAKKYTKNTKQYGENFTSDAPAALTSGEIDAIIVDYPVGAVMIKETPGFKIVGPFTNELYGIAIKQGETALKKEIDIVINNLEISGKMQQLKDRWLPKD